MKKVVKGDSRSVYTVPTVLCFICMNSCEVTLAMYT
jgi:hypothetical protein